MAGIFSRPEFSNSSHDLNQDTEFMLGLLNLAYDIDAELLELDYYDRRSNKLGESQGYALYATALLNQLKLAEPESFFPAFQEMIKTEPDHESGVTRLDDVFEMISALPDGALAQLIARGIDRHHRKQSAEEDALSIKEMCFDYGIPNDLVPLIEMIIKERRAFVKRTQMMMALMEKWG